MRKSRLEVLRDAQRNKFERIELTVEGLARLLADGDRPPEERRLNPTQWDFICDGDRTVGYMGPIGCAKTSTICAGGWLRALLEPGSKGLVARNNYNDLMDTTKLRMEEMLNRLPPGTLIDRNKASPEKWYIQPVGGGEPSQITFMGLQDGLGSYEFNWAIIDEVAEVAEQRVHEVDTRLRYVRPDTEPHENNYALRFAFNPPSKSHWLYTAATGKDYQEKRVRDPWVKLYVPSPDENARNLPAGYYERLAQSLPEDMKQRLIDGEWGSTFSGEPVYREFKPDLHVVQNLRNQVTLQDHTLFRFWDFGYNRPCVIWAVMTYGGRLLILREFLGEKMHAKAFGNLVLAQTKQYFPNATRFVDIGDPAVSQEKDTGSTLAVLNQLGIQMMYQRSRIDVGLQLVRTRLETLVDGKPAMLIDSGCYILIEGMRGGYRLDKRGEKPEKDGYYDHLNDALRYGVYSLYGATGTASPYSHGQNVTSVAQE